MSARTAMQMGEFRNLHDDAQKKTRAKQMEAFLGERQECSD
jgi:hypothetical protein